MNIKNLEFLDMDYRMSLVYQPFALEDTPGTQDLPQLQDAIIITKNGIAYIDKTVIGTSAQNRLASLDLQFKDLVDTVLKRKRMG